jgi:5-methylcytosine-specific restriction protein B
LSGLSGSGKTQLALRYGRALCGVDDSDCARVLVVTVQPGWYDASSLLGYPHPVQDEVYRSTPFLDLLVRAADDPGHPYVAILDEMNLSHPEQYLAPLLSTMETRGWIELHSFDEDTTPIPPRVAFPSNLALIGTVNMDETTHGLSDKMLDRAFTLEFWNIDVERFPGWSASPLAPADLDVTRRLLATLGAALSPVRMHFGWRTVDDVLGYVHFQLKAGQSLGPTLDDVVYAKVLPKLRGEDSPRFRQALAEVHELLATEGLPRCRAKVADLVRDLDETGAARFWR